MKTNHTNKLREKIIKSLFRYKNDKRGILRLSKILEYERRDYEDRKTDIEAVVDKILKLIKKELLKEMPDKRTEGILGILGTSHKDGVRNEGYNQALSEIKDIITRTLNCE